MQQKTLFITFASGVAFAYAVYRLLGKAPSCQRANEKPSTARPSDFESRSNPRTPLSELPPTSGRTGSGLHEGGPRPEQNSDWYGNPPRS